MPGWCFALSPPFSASPNLFCASSSLPSSLSSCASFGLCLRVVVVSLPGAAIYVCHTCTAGQYVVYRRSVFVVFLLLLSLPLVFGGAVSHWIRSVHFIAECNGGVARDHTVLKRTIVYSHSQMQGSNDSMSFERNVRCSRFVHKSGFQWAVLLSTSVAESLVLG